MTTVDVQVDLYSGRENPGWRLAEPDAAHFLDRIATLSRIPAADAAPPDRLGYRGVRVTVVSGGTQRHFAVADAVVFVEPDAPAGRQTFADPERALEKWLLATGRSVLGPALIDDLIGAASL